MWPGQLRSSKKIAPDWLEGKICEKEDLCGDIIKELGKREQKWAVALKSDQCELLNDSAKSELRTMLGHSESESSSNASDDDESSDQDNLSSINDSKDSGRNSDNGVDDSDLTEQCQEEDSGSVFNLLQWKHTTAAVPKTLAPTGTHWNALLAMSPLSNRLYIFTGHRLTVSRLSYVAFVEKENNNMFDTVTVKD